MLKLATACLVLISVVACGPSEHRVQEIVEESIRASEQRVQREVLKEQETRLDTAVRTIIDRTDERVLEGLATYREVIQAGMLQQSGNFQSTVNQQADNFQSLIHDQDRDIVNLHNVLVEQKRVIDQQTEIILDTVCALDYWRVAGMMSMALLTRHLSGDESLSPDDAWEAMLEPPSHDLFNEYSVACVVENDHFRLIGD